MLNVFTKFYKIGKQHGIMLNTFSISLIIWKSAIETWARNELGAWRPEQFPHLGNYTLTPVGISSANSNGNNVDVTSHNFYLKSSEIIYTEGQKIINELSRLYWYFYAIGTSC